MKSNLFAIAVVVAALVISLGIVASNTNPTERFVLSVLFGGIFFIYLFVVSIVYLLIRGR